MPPTPQFLAHRKILENKCANRRKLRSDSQVMPEKLEELKARRERALTSAVLDDEALAAALSILDQQIRMGPGILKSLERQLEDANADIAEASQPLIRELSDRVLAARQNIEAKARTHLAKVASGKSFEALVLNQKETVVFDLKIIQLESAIRGGGEETLGAIAAVDALEAAVEKLPV